MFILSHISRRRVACTCLAVTYKYNPLAKTRLVWHVKMNFISNKSLNNGTFSHFKRFLTSYRTRDMKFPVAKSSKQSVITHDASLAFINLNIHTIRSQKLLMSGASKWISFQIKSLNNGTFSHFKRFLTPLQNQRYENSKLPVAKSSKGYHTCRRVSLLQFARKTESRLQLQLMHS